MRYSTYPRDQIHVKGYSFLFFEKSVSKISEVIMDKSFLKPQKRQ